MATAVFAVCAVFIMFVERYSGVGGSSFGKKPKPLQQLFFKLPEKRKLPQQKSNRKQNYLIAKKQHRQPHANAYRPMRTIFHAQPAGNGAGNPGSGKAGDGKYAKNEQQVFCAFLPFLLQERKHRRCLPVVFLNNPLYCEKVQVAIFSTIFTPMFCQFTGGCEPCKMDSKKNMTKLKCRPDRAQKKKSAR